jgi:hypothetical protein
LYKIQQESNVTFQDCSWKHAAVDSPLAASRSSCHQDLHLTADARPDACLGHQAPQQRGIVLRDVPQLALLKSNKLHGMTGALQGAGLLI